MNIFEKNVAKLGAKRLGDIDSQIPSAKEDFFDGEERIDCKNEANVAHEILADETDGFPVSKHFKTTLSFAILSLLLVLGCGIAAEIYINSRQSLKPPAELSQDEKNSLNAVVAQLYSHGILRPLPYEAKLPPLDLQSKSAIVIDEANGCVVFEKNADVSIPPASMQKLVTMYLIFSDVAAKKYSLNDIVPIPEEALARNLPADASLMNLKPDQVVSVHDLLMGLAVPSGNDAAIALACFAEGSVPAFVARMNDEIQRLGIANTFFADPSGYSAENKTTARDFAAFCRIYTLRFPEALKVYNSAVKMVFPQKHNLRQGEQNSQVTLRTTNKVLQAIDGCDGLKTGYIDESGYNLALTVKNGRARLIAVLMGGIGRNSEEGNRIRIADSQAVTDWYYKNFDTMPTSQNRSYACNVWGGKSNAVNLVEVLNSAITVPKLTENAADKVIETVEVPSGGIDAPVLAGKQYGKIVYRLEGHVIQEVPLVADRNVKEGNFIKTALDGFAKGVLQQGSPK